MTRAVRDLHAKWIENNPGLAKQLAAMDQDGRDGYWNQTFHSKDVQLELWTEHLGPMLMEKARGLDVERAGLPPGDPKRKSLGEHAKYLRSMVKRETTA